LTQIYTLNKTIEEAERQQQRVVVQGNNGHTFQALYSTEDNIPRKIMQKIV
jgi:hypothetical protein